MLPALYHSIDTTVGARWSSLDDDTQSILERVFGRLRLGCMHNAQ